MANRATLSRKPLVEALLELRWSLQPISKAVGPGAPQTDPGYRFALGRFSALIEKTFPHYEKLPAASVPDEMVAHVVQHRFRHAPAAWPLVQIGPGVLTINETDKYSWQSFSSVAKSVVAMWHQAYPKDQHPKPLSAVLKYIDAVPFDHVKSDTFSFVNNLKLSAGLQTDFLSPIGAAPHPSSFQLRVGFPLTKPVGVLGVQISTAFKDGKPGIVWETTVNSADSHVPSGETELSEWLESAHTTLSDVFFAMTEGELHDSFV